MTILRKSTHMKTYIGPIARSKTRIKCQQMAKRYSNIFIAVSLFLPILLYGGFEFGFFSSGSKVDDNLIDPVAKVIIGTKSGTAFLISDNHLITANHVVEYADSGDVVQLVFEKKKIGRDQEAIVIYKNKDMDIAILQMADAKIGNFSNHLELASADDNVEINDEAFIIGYPGGQFNSLSFEIISDEFDGDDKFLQLYGGSWYGFSGAPVIHKKTKKVIGVALKKDLQNEGRLIAVKMDVLFSNQKIMKIIDIDE
jgi:S1-C subfamily serine protease